MAFATWYNYRVLQHRGAALLEGLSTIRASKSDWRPTKAELHRNHWRATRTTHVISRLVADLQIAGYEQAIEAYATGRLLDLGCGNAPFAGIYRPLVSDYIWADWPNSPHQLFELDIETDLNEAPLPIGDASFDTILLSDVLEHICEPDRLFAEMVRILRPGGHLIVGVPFCYGIHEEPFDFHRYTRFKLQNFGNKHGATVTELRTLGGGFDVLTDVACKLLGGAWKPLARLPYYAWKFARAVPIVRKLNDAAVSTLPIAYLVVYKRY